MKFSTLYLATAIVCAIFVILAWTNIFPTTDKAGFTYTNIFFLAGFLYRYTVTKRREDASRPA